MPGAQAAGMRYRRAPQEIYRKPFSSEAKDVYRRPFQPAPQVTPARVLNVPERVGSRMRDAKIIALLGGILAALTAILILLYQVFLAPARIGTPEETLAKFEQACESYDVSGYLECFDSESQGIYSGLMEVADMAGGALGIGSISGLMGTMEKLSPLMDAAGLMPKMDVQITVNNIVTEDETHCRVEAYMKIKEEYMGQTEVNEEGTVVFPMVLEETEWKINVIGMAEESQDLLNSVFGA